MYKFIHIYLYIKINIKFNVYKFIHKNICVYIFTYSTNDMINLGLNSFFLEQLTKDQIKKRKTTEITSIASKLC